MMQAYAPNGSLILGTLDTVQCRAEISGFTRNAAGEMEAEYAGGSEVFWDEQRTVERDGELVFLAEDGSDWKLSELTFRDDPTA